MKKNNTKNGKEGEYTLKNVQSDFKDVFEMFGKLTEYTTKRFDGVDQRFNDVDRRFDVIEGRLDNNESDIAFLKRNMVTKIYLDEKVGELRGDITELVHKEDRKFVELIHILENKEILSEEETVRILSMPPFPLGQAS